MKCDYETGKDLEAVTDIQHILTEPEGYSHFINTERYHKVFVLWKKKLPPITEDADTLFRYCWLTTDISVPLNKVSLLYIMYTTEIKEFVLLRNAHSATGNEVDICYI